LRDTRYHERCSPALAGIIGGRRALIVSMISASSMPCRYTEVMPRSACPELALDHDERHALACHLDCVCVAELMRRESPPHARMEGDPSHLGADRGGGARTPGDRAVDHTEQRADRQRLPMPKLWYELSPAPSVHADLAALSAPDLAGR
jgi:hypothetical protein